MDSCYLAEKLTQTGRRALSFWLQYKKRPFGGTVRQGKTQKAKRSHTLFKKMLDALKKESLSPKRLDGL